MATYTVKKDATNKCHIYRIESNGSMTKISDANGEANNQGSTYRAKERSSDGKCCIFRISSDLGGSGSSELIIVEGQTIDS